MQQNQSKRDREPDVHDRMPKHGPVDTSPNAEEKGKAKITGVVTDCTNLNIREQASPDADVLTTIPALAEVVIDINASTDGFYKICTAAGVEGFCMRKYIAVRR